MESAGNPDPEYKQYGFMLKAKLISTQRDTGGQTGGQMKTKNSATANSILKAMAKDPKVTRKTLSKVLGISPSAVQKHINKLKEEKRIARIGGDFGGHWEIVRI